MKFSVKPEDLAKAIAENATTMREAAAELVRAHVDKTLVTLIKKLEDQKSTAAQQSINSPIRIMIDTGVTGNSKWHKSAIDDVAIALVRAGFEATSVFEEAYDDGPGRYTPEYQYIEIKF